VKNSPPFTVSGGIFHMETKNGRVFTTGRNLSILRSNLKSTKIKKVHHCVDDFAKLLSYLL